MEYKFSILFYYMRCSCTCTRRQPLQQHNPSFQRKPLGIVDDSRDASSQNVTGSFTVYDEASASSFLGQIAKKKTLSDAFPQESFSVLEDPSLIGDNQSRCASQRSTLESFSVFEDPSMTCSNLENNSSNRKPLGDIIPDTSRTKFSVSQATAQSFSVYEDPSISEPHRQQLSSRNVSRDVSQHNPAESFSVFEDPSISSTSCPKTIPLSRVVPDDTSLHRTTESFSVFEDPSQLSIARLQQSNRGQCDTAMESFSVYEDPSQRSLRITDTVGPNMDGVQSKGKVLTAPNPIAPNKGVSPPEITGFTEFEIPSHTRFEPTSTPSGGRRMGECSQSVY